MMNLSFGQPLFAVGPQEVIALIFVLVSVIGWIIRQVQGTNQQMPPPVQRPGRRREERASDEIDNFLQQVNRASEPNKPPAVPRPTTAANRPKPPGNRGPATATQRQPAKPQPAAPVQESRRIREEDPARPAGSTLGSSLNQHVREHMAERIVKEAQRDVGQDIKDSVQKHMGNISRPAPGTSSPGRVTTAALFSGNTAPADPGCCARADNLKKMLRNPESIRQAIIIQEVMNRPKCLR